MGKVLLVLLVLALAASSDLLESSGSPVLPNNISMVANNTNPAFRNTEENVITDGDHRYLMVLQTTEQLHQSTSYLLALLRMAFYTNRVLIIPPYACNGHLMGLNVSPINKPLSFDCSRVVDPFDLYYDLDHFVEKAKQVQVQVLRYSELKEKNKVKPIKTVIFETCTSAEYAVSVVDDKLCREQRAKLKYRHLFGGYTQITKLLMEGEAITGEVALEQLRNEEFSNVLVGGCLNIAHSDLRTSHKRCMQFQNQLKNVKSAVSIPSDNDIELMVLTDFPKAGDIVSGASAISDFSFDCRYEFLKYSKKMYEEADSFLKRHQLEKTQYVASQLRMEHATNATFLLIRYMEELNKLVKENEKVFITLDIGILDESMPYEPATRTTMTTNDLGALRTLTNKILTNPKYNTKNLQFIQYVPTSEVLWDGAARGIVEGIVCIQSTNFLNIAERISRKSTYTNYILYQRKRLKLENVVKIA